MLKKTLALLILGAAFSAPSWAHDGYAYGRVIRVEPTVSFAFGDRRSQFQILYEFGGDRYWTYSDYYPGPWIAIPPPRYVYAPPRYVYRYGWDGGWGYRDHHHWRNGWDGRRGGWDDDHHGRRFDRD